MSTTYEYEPDSITYYQGQWVHFFKIRARPDYISAIMLRAPHKYVVDIVLKYDRYIKGKILNNQQLSFFEDDEGDVGIAALNFPHIMEISLSVSQTDSPVSILVTGYDRTQINGINNLHVYYHDLNGEKHKAIFNNNLNFIDTQDINSDTQNIDKLPIEEVHNQALPDADNYHIRALPYRIFDNENKVVIFLNELSDVYRKFFVYLPKYTPPNYVTDRRAKSQGGKMLKKYIHIYRFICNNEIISEFNHGRLLNTEEPDLYEMQFFMTEDGKALNIPCKLAPRTSYRIEIEFSENVPEVKQMCYFTEVGDYNNSAIKDALNLQESYFKIKGSTPIEMGIRGGLVTFKFLMPHLNKSKSCYD